MQVSQRSMCLAGAVVLAAGGLFAAGDRDVASTQHNEQLSGLMLAKLASSQKIVSGLVSEDFAEIRKGAEELNRICEATEWAAHSDQIYAHHRTELRRQSLKLVKMADERNLDGAAFTYMHSLTTCISCHQHCRHVLKIADDVAPLEKVVPIPVTEDEPQRLGSRPIRR
ncbi:MAG: hypothetical protein B7Z55_09290 [Planctomycetales bacterium 12-60-4]|nr:MAG: hypothetical protein B7Z55_09290 [Planctomycetales bacterium 12-60-4]